MINVVKAFNNSGTENILYDDLLNFSTMPRLSLDKYFNAAEKMGLVRRNAIFIEVTEEGILYAEEHKIIDVK